jgi:DNA-binding transcriptional ArsR family regulator
MAGGLVGFGMSGHLALEPDDAALRRQGHCRMLRSPPKRQLLTGSLCRAMLAAMDATVSGTTLAELAALIGDVARANILSALMDGRALTAGELAWHAGVSAQTTSGHLAKLAEGRLVTLERQGRHRYFRLASPEVAHAVEALMTVAISGPKRHRPTGPRDEALRAARTCYDHLAGRLGVALADALTARGLVILDDGTGMVTPNGRRFLCESGSTSGRRIITRGEAAPCVERVSTGASGVRISPAAWGPPCAAAVSTSVGSRVAGTAAP